MARLLDRFTDAEIMKMMITRDFSAVSNTIIDDEVKELGPAFKGLTDETFTIQFPNLRKIGDNALMSTKLNLVCDFTKITSIGSSALSSFAGTGIPSKLELTSLTELKGSAFQGVKNVEEIHLPNLERFTSGYSYFSSMANLKRVRAEKLLNTNQNTFSSCPELVMVDLGAAQSFNIGAFGNCPKLETVRIGAVRIGGFDVAFSGNTSLKAVIMDHLTNIPSMASLRQNAPMNNGTCFVYVPKDFVTTLRAADEWKNYAGQIIAIEDHPEVMPVWDDGE